MTRPSGIERFAATGGAGAAACAAFGAGGAGVSDCRINIV